MTGKLRVRLTAAVLSATLLLPITALITARPVVAQPASPIGAVVMIAGTKVTGTVPYGERTFRPEDRTLSCIVVFTKPAPGTKIRTDWYVVDGKQETKFHTHDLAMGEDNAKFSIFTLNKPWPTGKYRVKVSVAGKFDRAITFNIQ